MVWASLCIVATLTLAISFSNCKEYNLAPGNSRVLSYSTTFCQSLSINSSSPKLYQRQLLLLHDEPPLSVRDNFTIDYTKAGILLHGRSNFSYNYYLYPGSNFSMAYCRQQDYPQVAEFFIIRKESNLHLWEENGQSSKYAVTTIAINNTCNQGNSMKTFSYNITTAEEYYFVFYNPSLNETASFKVLMVFERMLYNITSENTVSNCKIFPGLNSTCTIDIPYNSDYTAVVSLEKKEKTNYLEKVAIDWNCSTRVWVYVVITLPPGLFLIILCAIVIAIAVCCYCRAKRRKYRSLNSDTSETTRINSVTSSLFLGNDPNAEYHRNSAPPPYSPGYGTTSGDTRIHPHSLESSTFTVDSPGMSDPPKPPKPPSKQEADLAPDHAGCDTMDSPPSYESTVDAAAAALL